MNARFVSSFFVVAVAGGTTFLACGGDDDGGGGGTPDAKVFMDAAPQMDAASGITGLGQKCGSGLPACPSNAPDCIALRVGSGASPAYCTPHCLDDGTATTNGSAQFAANSFTPPADPAKCGAAYTAGAPGVPACGVLLAYNPMDNPLQANKQYTMIDLGCVVQCGSGSTCPAGMTCTSNFCFPN